MPISNHTVVDRQTFLTLILFPTIQYRAENRTRGRFLARIAPARDCPLPPARATFSTQSRFYQSARYCSVCVCPRDLINLYFFFAFNLFKIEYDRAIVSPLKRDIEMCGVRANFVNRARLKFFKFLSLIKTTGVAQTRAAVIEMLAKSKCDCVSLASCYVLSTRSDKEHSPGIATE